MSFLTGFLAAGIVLLSAYSLTKSFASASNIKVYEEKAEKAADWSNTAKKRLWDTRYTIGAGLVSAAVSLVAGLVYLVGASGNSALLPSILGAAIVGAAQYMQNFWAAKSKVPLLDQYNAAIKQSWDVVTLLYLLAAAWGMTAVLKLVGL